MNYPHLISGISALLLFAATSFIGTRFAQSIEIASASEYSTSQIPLKISGSALITAALQHEDQLVVVGASETLSKKGPYQAGRFFHHSPTGFEVFEVARGGSDSLVEAQIVAGTGGALRGKKIVISFTPFSFEIPASAYTDYARVASLLHANQFIFSPILKNRTKWLGASQMWRYRRAFDEDPLLSFAVSHLAKGRIRKLDQFLYYLSFPLGIAQTELLTLEDHLLVLTHILEHPKKPPQKKERSGPIDWDALAEKAKKGDAQRSASNPFGIDDWSWHRRLGPRFVHRDIGSLDHSYRLSLAGASEWEELRLLLSSLKDLGAQPLLLGRPIKGQYYEARGISANARNLYYDKIEGIARAYKVPIVDFREFDQDLYFGVDKYPHTAQVGWVHVDQILDQFYHDKLPK